MPQDFSKSIFISYNRRDLKTVETLVENLKRLKHDVWFDQAITGGQRWWDGILAKIRDCEIFIFTLTPDSLKSDACWQELNYARELRKLILPIRLSDKVNVSQLWPPLSEYQTLDYLRQDTKTTIDLVNTLTSLPSPGPLPDPLPEPPPIPVSYLENLRKQIEATKKLSFEEQAALVFKLKKRLGESRSPEEVEEARALLVSLRRRADLFAPIADEIDASIKSPMLGRALSEIISKIIAGPAQTRSEPPAEKEVRSGSGSAKAGMSTGKKIAWAIGLFFLAMAMLGTCTQPVYNPYPPPYPLWPPPY